MHNVFGHIVGTQKVENYILHTHWLVNLAINVLSAVTKVTQIYIMHSDNEKWFGDWQDCKMNLLEFKIPHSSLSVSGIKSVRSLLDSGQRTSCMLPTQQLCTTVPLITEKQETTPIFHAGISYWKSLRERIPHLELHVESEHAQDLIDNTL